MLEGRILCILLPTAFEHRLRATLVRIKSIPVQVSAVAVVISRGYVGLLFRGAPLSTPWGAPVSRPLYKS